MSELEFITAVLERAGFSADSNLQGLKKHAEFAAVKSFDWLCRSIFLSA